MEYTLFSFVIVTMMSSLLSVHGQTFVTGVVGKSVTLECDLPKTDPPQIRWVDWVHNTGRDASLIYNGTSINSKHPNKDNLVVDSAYSLSINNLKLSSDSDAGEYICYSKQADGKEEEKAFRVNIGGLPECSGNSDLSEGQTTLLTCQAPFSGNMVPKLNWYMGSNEQESLESNDIGIAKEDYTIAGASHNLDGKTFTCKMEMGGFTEECSLPVSVTYMVRDLMIMPESESIVVDEEIKCSAKGNPAPSIDLKVTTEGDAQVDIMADSDSKFFKVGKELEGKQVTVSCTASNTFNGKVENLNKKVKFTVRVPPTTTTTTTTTTTVPPTEKPEEPLKEKPTPKPEEDKEPGQKEGGNVVGIVAGVIIAALVIVIIVIAVVCIRRRNSKKHKGAKPVPTKEEEIRRLEDGKGGPNTAVAYSEGEKHGRYRRTNISGSPSNGAIPYDGVVYHNTAGDKNMDVDIVGSVDLDNNNPFGHHPPSRVDFTENDYTQILHPDTLNRVH